MKKLVKLVVLVGVAIVSATTMHAHIQQLKITNAVKKGGGTIQFKTNWPLSFTWDVKMIGLVNPTSRIYTAPKPYDYEWNYGANCVCCYQLFFTGGAWAGEIIKANVPSGDNWCWSRRVTLGTVDELKGQPNVYIGERKMLAIKIDKI